MESIRICVPKHVIQNERYVLDGPVMSGKRIQEKVVSKRLQDQKWTFNERIVVRQILIVPNKLSLQRRGANGKPNEREERATYPIAP
jgi:hypothetical protein